MNCKTAASISVKAAQRLPGRLAEYLYCQWSAAVLFAKTTALLYWLHSTACNLHCGQFYTVSQN